MHIVCKKPDIDEFEPTRAFLWFAVGEKHRVRASRLSDTDMLHRGLEKLQEQAGVRLTAFSVPDLVRVCEAAIAARPEHPELTPIWTPSDAGMMMLRIWPDVDPEGVASIYMRRQDKPEWAARGRGFAGTVWHGKGLV